MKTLVFVRQRNTPGHSPSSGVSGTSSGRGAARDGQAQRPAPSFHLLPFLQFTAHTSCTSWSEWFNEKGLKRNLVMLGNNIITRNEQTRFHWTKPPVALWVAHQLPLHRHNTRGFTSGTPALCCVNQKATEHHFLLKEAPGRAENSLLTQNQPLSK